jgi:riboflavin biosynthesis pyrimidine reductase
VDRLWKPVDNCTGWYLCRCVRQLLPAPVAEIDPAVVYGGADRALPGGRPWLVANMVASVDGRAAVEGRTSPLSGPGDRAVFRLLRSVADVVLVGAGTVRIESYGPLCGLDPSPIAVLSRSLDLDWDGPLFQAGERTMVVTCEAADPDRRRRGAEVAEVIVAGDDSVDMARALAELAHRGHRLVLCEGGPQLLSELVDADLVDELCLTLSPLLVGTGGPGLLADGYRPMPAPLRLASVLEDDHSLFLRYLRR